MLAKVFAIFLISTSVSPATRPLLIGSGTYSLFRTMEDCKLAEDIVNIELKPYYVRAQCLPVEFKRKEAGE